MQPVRSENQEALLSKATTHLAPLRNCAFCLTKEPARELQGMTARYGAKMRERHPDR